MKNSSEYQKMYREKNKEKLRENAKRYYQENKERISEKRKQHIENHRDEYRERARRYAEKNKEKLKQYRKEYYLENKEYIDAKTKEWSINNKDKKRNWYLEYKNSFFDMYGRKCACCGEKIFEFLTIEHKKGREITDKKKKTCSYRDYKDATSEYRPDLYETLCMNCNHAKGRFGKCPHEELENKK